MMDLQALRKDLLTPTPGRAAQALRMGLICTLTLLIAETYGTPEIALTTYVVFFMNQPDRMGSLVQTLAITVLITVVLAGLFLLAPAMIASPPWRIATMTGLSFGLMFLNSASKLQGVAATVALVVVYCLALLGSNPSGELATRALLYAWLFAGIPAAASTVVNLLLAPAPWRLTQQALAGRLQAAAQALADPGGPAAHSLRMQGVQDDAAVQKALRMTRLERTLPPQHLDALQALSDRVVALEAAVQLMVETPDTLPPQDAREAMVRTLSEMAGILTRGGYPACVEAIDGVAQAMPAARQPWLLFNAALAGCGEPRAEAAPAQPASGFFLPDAFHHPRHIRHALKVTGAALLCYLFYTATSWPGIHTALITCFIVSLGTAADSIEKLQLRLTGCVAGAACGIGALLLVIPKLTDIGGLCLLVFAGASVGAWVAAGTPRVAYAGLQFAFAFFLCVIQGSGPGFDLVVARDRIIGILLGNLVSYLVMTRLWPVSVSQRIDEALDAAQGVLATLQQTQPSWWRWRQFAGAQGRLDSAAVDLQLALLEPPAIRPTDAWLAERRARLQQARPLGARLVAAAEALDLPPVPAPAALSSRPGHPDTGHA